jgi:hypothetical protein
MTAHPRSDTTPGGIYRCRRALKAIDRPGQPERDFLRRAANASAFLYVAAGVRVADD